MPAMAADLLSPSHTPGVNLHTVSRWLPLYSAHSGSLRLLWVGLMWFYRLLCGLSCCLLLACQPEQAVPQWGHDAYIWQRAWRPALLQAVQEGGALFQQWRVLGLEGDARSGSWYRVKVEAAALQHSAHPVWLVVRMNGALGQYNEADTLRTIMGTLAQWQSLGIPLAGLEIDHDCGENSLPGYARFLQTLRQQLKGKLPLSITMLPAWLDSPQLGHIIAASDQRVLQVHAVQNPRKGLFHPQQAEDWIRRLSRSTDQRSEERRVGKEC